MAAPTVTIDTGLRNGGHSIFRVDTVVNTDHVVAVEEETIAVSGLTAPRVMTLPNAPATGRRIKFKDADGTVTLINTITVNGNGHNIDGAATAVILTAFGRLVLEFIGTNWIIVG